MIQIVYLCSGLANRMFQYAFYLSLKEKGFKVQIADNSIVKELKHEDVSLAKIFNNVSYEKASKLKIFLMGGGNDALSRIIRNRLKLYSPFYERTAAKDGFREELFKIQHPAFHAGVFQSEKYFENIKEKISFSFQFQPFSVNSQNYILQQQMSKENSVAIHVRKGKDYQNGIPYKNTCSIEYYINAINYIKSKIKNPTFYVFTDNSTWVKNNFKDLINYTLIDWNPAIGEGNHYDMQLMSCAKHNIIANSTYSWWGAWLNSNPQKIVIGPQKWFNPEIKDYYKKDLYILPQTWIKL